ncbi:Hsp70 family protein [Dactylosporangium roseum]|uniref:Hsp70 family protein n=1 Tax=Dactylosporangium roseum TaxID=47989 RepID=A0ABY5Z9S4_9ACTN|nr:Hsp70 family protein [Dactylosporangium roseum]UWZ38843.1 Hsp70 family protein [Dactylosporangium roseum]
MSGFVVGIDLGTSNTVAVIRSPDGRRRPVLFDGAPLMPSAVFMQDNGQLAVGRDAQRLAQLDPGRFEPNPKRRLGDPTVLLGDVEVPTVHLLTAVLRSVAAGVGEITRFPPTAVLTYPASWGRMRRSLLHDAAVAAGFPQVSLVPEPVAAARYFISALNHPLPRGSAMAVYDFGGGTVDVAVVRNDEQGFTVIGSGGLEDVGGLDIDAALVELLGEVLRTTQPDAWRRLDQPVSSQDRRDRRLFWEDIRGAKEMLSRTTVAPVSVPGVEAALHLTREELERRIGPMIRRTVAETARVVQECHLETDQLAGIMLVGGSSRVPLVARMLHRELRIAPTVLEQPELPVAEGAVVHPAELGTDGRLGVATGSASVGGPFGGGHRAPQGYPTQDYPAGPYQGTPPQGYPAQGYPPPPTGPGSPVPRPPVYGSPNAVPVASAASVSAQPVSAQPVSAQPVSAQPVSAQPVSAQPVSAQPVSAQPVSAQPVSAQPGSHVPVSAVPVSPAFAAAGAPVSPTATMANVAVEPGGEAPPARGRNRRALLAGLVALLVLIGGGIWALTAFRDRDDSGGTDVEPIGSWKRLPDVPTEADGTKVGIEAAGAAVVGTKLYVIGGFTAVEPRKHLASVWIYDLEQGDQGTWTKGPGLPVPTSHMGVVVDPVGSLWVIGGWTADGASDQVLRLDKNGDWAAKVPLPEPRNSGAAVWDGQGIVYAGGTGKDGMAKDTIWGLSKDGTEWQVVGNLSKPREKLAAVSDGAGTVLFVGGVFQRRNEKYDDVDVLRQRKVVDSDGRKLDHPREGAAAVKIEGIGLCVLGGHNGSEVYDWWCADQSKTPLLPKLTMPRAGMALASGRGSIFVIGGYNPAEALNGTNTVETFTPTR